jgi:hypothetical protein
MPDYQQPFNFRPKKDSEDSYIPERLERSAESRERTDDATRDAMGTVNNIDKVLAESGQTNRKALKKGEEDAVGGDSDDDISADDLAGQEDQAAANPYGYPEGSENDEGGWRKGRLKGPVASNRKFKLLGTKRRRAAAAGIGGVILVGGGFMAYGYLEYMMPKIISQAVERKADEVINSQSKKAVRNRVNGWIVKKLMPSVRTCGELAKTDCVAKELAKDGQPKTLTEKLWQNWGTKAALQKMSDAGITLEVNKSGTYKLIVSGGSGGTETKTFRNKYEASDAFMDRMESAGKMNFVQKRRLLKEVGLPGCNFFCDPLKVKENAKLKVVDAIQEFRSALIGLVSKRLIAPSVKGYAILFECMLGSSTCKGPEDMAKRVKELQPDISPDALDALVKEGQARSTEKVVQTIARQAIESFAGKEIAEKISTKAIPVIGWILGALQISQFVLNTQALITGGSSAAKTFANGMKLGQAKPSAQVLMTMGSEKTGVPTDSNTPAASLANAKLLEGYGNSKLMQDMFGSQTPNDQSGEKCPNGGGIKKGESVCSAFRFDRNPPFVDAVNKVPGLKTLSNKMSPYRTVINLIMLVINWPIDKALMTCTDASAKGFLLCTGATFGQNIPLLLQLKGLGLLTGEVANAAKDMLGPFFDYGAHMALGTFYKDSTEAKGARFFEAGVAGRDHIAYDAGKQLYGGQEMSNDDAKTYAMAADQEERNEMKVASLGTKLFSFENPYSVVSRIALNSPFTSLTSPNAQTFMSVLNPFKFIGKAFTGFSPAHAEATQMTSQERFGIPSVGVSNGCVDNDSTTPIDNVDTSPHLDDGKPDAIGEPSVKSENCDMFNTEIGIMAGNGFTTDPIPDVAQQQ